MPTPLNPLIVARLRKHWMHPDVKLGILLEELKGWVHLLGPGPYIPTCNTCQKELSFDWRLCLNCSIGNVICSTCYECYNCEVSYASSGCCACGNSCGAHICRDCKIDDGY